VVERARSFGASVEQYQQGRPEYPAEAVEWFVEPQVKRIADVGAGSGKLTAALINAAPEVIAIDPDQRMLAALSKRLPEVQTLIGTGESLPLTDNSVDAVTFGQAWHWVDPLAASTEIGRALTPGGLLGLFWNIRDTRVDWVADFNDLIGASDAEKMVSRGGPSVGPEFSIPQHFTTSWTTQVTVDDLISMVSSRSAVITATEDRRTTLLAEVRAFFTSNPAITTQGHIEMPYQTHVFKSHSLR